jgi:hypothetical protein
VRDDLSLIQVKYEPASAVKFEIAKRVPMSALGQKQTSGLVERMSALPPKADVEAQSWNVRFVPKADIATTRLWL